MSAASRPKKIPFKSPIELALRELLAHRFWIALSILLAAATGVAAAWKLASTRQTFQGKLLYTRNNITEPFYFPPDLHNLTSAIVSPQMLDDLRTSHDIVDELSTFRQRLRFEASGDSTLDVFYTHKDPAICQSLLQDAMQRFVDAHRELRSQSLKQFIADFESEGVSNAQRLAEAKQRLEELLNAHSLTSEKSLIAEIESIRRSLADFESRLELARTNFELTRLQVQSLVALDKSKKESTLNETNSEKDHLDRAIKLTRARANTPSTPATVTNDHEYVTQAGFPPLDPMASAEVDLQLRSLLEDRIAKEKESSTYNAMLTQKIKEIERARIAHQKDLISDSALEQLEAELEILRSQRSQQVKSLETQLESINGRIKERYADSDAPADALGSTATLVSPSRTNEMQTLALLRGAEQAAKSSIEYLEATLDERRASLTHLTSLQKEVEPVVAKVDAASSAVAEARSNAEKFNQALRSTADQLTVVQDASLMIDGVSDNSLKLFSAGFFGVLALLVLPLFLNSLHSAVKNTPEASTLLGLPIVGRKVSKKETRRNPTAAKRKLNLIAIRLQHALGTAKRIVTVAGGDTDAITDDVIEHLAAKLKADGASVSIISASEMLRSDQNLDLTGEPIDDLSAKQNLSKVSKEHDFVLISSPILSDAVLFESVATLSDAIVIVASDAKANGANMQLAIADLQQSEVPVLGFVLQR